MTTVKIYHKIYSDKLIIFFLNFDLQQFANAKLFLLYHAEDKEPMISNYFLYFCLNNNKNIKMVLSKKHNLLKHTHFLKILYS